jgi:hypothetical protein
MSAVEVIACEIKDMKLVAKALKRCKGVFVDACLKVSEEPKIDTHRLYSKDVTGVGIRLDGWKYPVVLKDGEISYDNFNGSWGRIERLQEFQQAYAVESVKAKAYASGRFMSISEAQREDGCVEIMCSCY